MAVEVPIAIWGDASLDDPWAGPLVGIFTRDDDDLAVHDDAEEVTVQGTSGLVAPMPLFQAVSSEEWGHIVTWRDRSGVVLEVAARGASPDEARGIAERVTLAEGLHPMLPTDALGPATAPIHEGVGMAAYPFASTGQWTLSYRPRNLLATDQPRLLTISGLPGKAEDLQTLRFWAVTTQPFQVRGHDGLEYAAFDPATGPFGLAWPEAPGLNVQVIGLGFEQESLRDIVEALEDVDTDGWQTMQQEALDAGCD